MPQFELFEPFRTAAPSSPLFCHQEFLEKLAQHRQDPIGKRASLLLQRLAVDSRRQYYKATHGPNRGWRRSRLGGNHGSHFYAWWAPKSAAPLKEGGGFAEAPEGALFLRDIRHHDDHSLLTAQSLDDQYLPISVQDVRQEEYGPAPWTQTQARFAAARQTVRLLKGHPGSGKTTALWHAADAAGAQHVLYVTYSRDLAALARGFFDRYCSSHKHFHVVTFSQFIRELLGEQLPVTDEHETRKRFVRDAAPFTRTQGIWVDQQAALYDELHAHLVGDALPIPVGRFSACSQPRVSDKNYRERRTASLGHGAASSALEVADRLQRAEPATLAQRYMPELALAWQAADRLRRFAAGDAAVQIPPEWRNFDCIAVDECQDLTPIEAFVLIQLAVVLQKERRAPVPFLIAGDEAQTVRPTDFEWGWLNDLLHSQVGMPAEFKLSSNLRSPRRIAELVNRVWDLYSQVQKQERPRGTGVVDIEEDAADQILYCTAAPGADLDELIVALSAREGLALISLDETVPAGVPEAARSAVLTVAEAKGLDFHSVCVLDAGRQLEKILYSDDRWRVGADIETLRKRLAIDRLRVALSRPTERLFWLDINPTDKAIRHSLAFLNGGTLENGISPLIPAAILKTLEEEQLDIEERLQRCQADARQYLAVRPEVAYSRAQQAVTLLGQPDSPAAITDEAARAAAYLTLSEICFCLAFRKTRLPPELGRPNLFDEARMAAVYARRPGLGAIFSALEKLQRADPRDRIGPLAELAQALPEHRDKLEPWLLVEIEPHKTGWVEELEAALFNAHNAAVLGKVLPPFYEALSIPDSEARTKRLQQRAIQVLVKEKQFVPALALLQAAPERQPKLEATCHEGLGDFKAAADCYRAGGQLKEALQCYRSVPDLEAARSLIRELGEHPAAESLEWIARLQSLVAERPEKFSKVLTAAEKKILEELLERSLGVTRRKPAPRKTATKKTGAKKAATPRKQVRK